MINSEHNDRSAAETWFQLGKDLQALAGRTVYHIIEFCDLPPVPGKRYATAAGYRKMPNGDPQATLYELFGTINQEPDVDFAHLYPEIRYEWFSPDPVGMLEADLEEMVQYRRMTPLTVLIANPEGKYQRHTVYVVPQSVLARPKNDFSRFSRFGEPWCHTCNKTFFWSEDHEEVYAYISQGGKKCSICNQHMPGP